MADPLLAIDTSGGRAYCVAQASDGTLHERVSTSEMSHNEELAHNIESTLASAQISPKDLRAIILGSGPGSFTGLRIGYSVAKGMAISLRIPIVELSSHLGFVYGSEVAAGSVVILGDARRDEYFCSAYRISGKERVVENLLAPHLLSASNLDRLIGQFPGEEALTVISEIPGLKLPRGRQLDPTNVAGGLILAAKQVPRGHFSLELLAAMEPTYIRAVAAKTIAERLAQ